MSLLAPPVRSSITARLYTLSDSQNDDTLVGIAFQRRILHSVCSGLADASPGLEIPRARRDAARAASSPRTLGRGSAEPGCSSARLYKVALWA